MNAIITKEEIEAWAHENVDFDMTEGAFAAGRVTHSTIESVAGMFASDQVEVLGDNCGMSEEEIKTLFIEAYTKHALEEGMIINEKS